MIDGIVARATDELYGQIERKLEKLIRAGMTDIRYDIQTVHTGPLSIKGRAIEWRVIFRYTDPKEDANDE